MATRLRVFAAVKSHMEATGECPSATEIAQRIGIDRGWVSRHMAALNGATGLPLPITRKMGGAHDDQSFAGNMAAASIGCANAYAPIPVDVLMQIPQR
jgi:hypothetical protein